METTFQTRLKGGKGVTLTYVLAACGDEVGELEEDVREDEGAKYLDATELHAAAFGGRADRPAASWWRAATPSMSG